MQETDPAKAGFATGRLDRIGAWMRRYVGERKYPGSSVLIARGGRILHAHAEGLRDVKGGQPFTRDTVARIYSMTKPITTVAAMMLVERGLFHLDAPLSAILPEFSDMQALIPGAERLDQVVPVVPPTLHHLLTHTSGLTYAFNPNLVAAEMLARKIEYKPTQGTLGDMVRRTAELPLAFAPGSRWDYSVGIDVIGRVVEVVSGRSLAEFLESEILAPLAMTDTAFVLPEGARERFASLYTPLEGDAMALNAKRTGGETLRLIDSAATTPYAQTTLFSGGGGLLGTIDDYMRFCEMLRQGGALGDVRLLSPRTVDFMMQNHLPGDIASMGPDSFAEQPMEGTGFGLGGSVVLAPGRTRAPGSRGDFSWGGMASTFFWIDRAQEMSVVFFTQLSPSSSYPSRAELKALVHGALVS